MSQFIVSKIQLNVPVSYCCPNCEKQIETELRVAAQGKATIDFQRKRTVAEETATGATVAFNTALLANPATWVVIGLGAMAAALIKLRSEQEKAIEEEYGLSEAQKKSIDATKQAADEYKRTSEARSESIQSTEAEFGYIQHLKDEYNSLIDANGKVKKGYKINVF